MIVCVVFVVLSACVSVGVDALAVVVVTVKKKQNEICNSKKLSRERIYLHYGVGEFEKIRPASNYEYYGFN